MDVVLAQRSVQKSATSLAAQSVQRGAVASAQIEGDSEAIGRGAARVSEEAAGMVALWRTAPLQVLARLHLLAAADLADADALGRPTNPTAARRLLSTMAEVTRSSGPGSGVPALVVAAMVHAEAAESFTPAGGLVGRAAERVALLSSGVDPSGVLVPEEGHLAEVDGYLADRSRLQTGTDLAVVAWVERCCRAYTASAEAMAARLAITPGGS